MRTFEVGVFVKVKVQAADKADAYNRALCLFEENGQRFEDHHELQTKILMVSTTLPIIGEAGSSPSMQRHVLEVMEEVAPMVYDTTPPKCKCGATKVGRWQSYEPSIMVWVCSKKRWWNFWKHDLDATPTPPKRGVGIWKVDQ